MPASQSFYGEEQLCIVLKRRLWISRTLGLNLPLLCSLGLSLLTPTKVFADGAGCADLLNTTCAQHSVKWIVNLRLVGDNALDRPLSTERPPLWAEQGLILLPCSKGLWC